MLSASLKRAFWLSLFCLVLFANGFGQTVSRSLSPDEQYRQMSALMVQQNYDQIIVECKALIERAPDYHNAYLRLVFASDEAGQLEQTRAWFASLLSRTPSQPMANFGLALISEVKLDYAAAIDYFQKCLRDAPGADRAALLMVEDYFSLKKTADAETFFKSLISAHADSLAGHQGLGWLYAFVGRRSDAIAEFDRVIALAPDHALAYANKAYVLTKDGYYPQALDSLQTCLRLLEASPDEELEKKALLQLSDVFRRTGNYSEAAKTLDRFSAMALAAGDLENAEVALTQLGSVHYRLGEYVKTLECWQQAVKVSKKIASRKMQTTTHLQNHIGNIGDVYYQLGDLAAAEQMYLEAIKLSSEAKDDVNRSSVLKSLGDLYVEQGKLNQALSIFEEALALGQKVHNLGNQIGALLSLSALHRQLGNYGSAMDYAQQVIKLISNRSNPLWQSQSLNNLGFLHLRFNELPQARAAFEQALAIDPNTTAPDLVWQSHFGLATVDEKLGQPDKAYKHYQQAIESIERVRAQLGSEEQKSGFFAGKIEVYQKLIALLLKLHDADPAKSYAAEAFRYSERARARAFLDLLAEARVNVEQNVAPGVKYPDPVSLAQVQRTLDEKTVLLSYSLAEPASFLFAVSKTDFQVKRLPSASSLGVEVQKLLPTISDKNSPDPRQYQLQAVTLSSQLLKPVAQMFAGKSSLIIVPDGALHRLPFATLLVPGAMMRDDLRQLPYLIRQFAISYAPSASVLIGLENQQRQEADKGFIAFGDPIYRQRNDELIDSTLRTASGGSLNLQRLPYSRAEVEGIAKLFAADDRELFLGDAATEGNAKAPERFSRYRMVHFSTHGYLNETRPRFSGLLLSLPATNSQSEDGLLSAYEIFNLKLNADLVVLSACETGLGKEVKGEGMISLTRAFMYAGTPSVVVSLWNVNDETAADLMIRFYRYLKTDRLSKAEALRRAQLDTIRDNGFPFFWAPFVLVGKS